MAIEYHCIQGAHPQMEVILALVAENSSPGASGGAPDNHMASASLGLPISCARSIRNFALKEKAPPDTPAGPGSKKEVPENKSAGQV